MSVGIVILTHGQVGEAIIKAAEFILGRSLADIRLVPFTQSGEHTMSDRDLRVAIGESDEGDGILILTDLPGASPANLVTRLLSEFRATMVTGINLAMLLRVWNYRELPLNLLASKAVEGGKKGIEAIDS
jgi:PTS system ascorbate-specific IIA component